MSKLQKLHNWQSSALMKFPLSNPSVNPTTTMSQDNNNDHNKDDEHEQDMVMPGFRFHPTEEELIEFYLRRKVEGKRFNVELITFLDLYRYDPWELPALAAIGEKEWYFYVPRDRKYRNGDRPNRVTTSGYWKATGADRMIRTENFRSIGLKKTLVFYSGKAPKGIRSSWIMNEYRLPQHETERLQKVEISLCRVYKRAGVEDHPSLPRSLQTRASSSRLLPSTNSSSKKNQEISMASSSAERFQSIRTNPGQQMAEKLSGKSANSSTDIATPLGLSDHINTLISLAPMTNPSSVLVEDDRRVILQQSKQGCDTTLSSDCATMFGGSSFVPTTNAVDDLHRLVNFQQGPMSHQELQYLQNNQHSHHHPSGQFSGTIQPQQVPDQSSLTLLNMLPGSLQGAFTDRLWDWNSINEASKDFINNSPFK
ncbi:hypothetical protein ACH5RR_022698 [Cinchona calisaya]|uniref:NAC domain-containing protein n=1 Tax=Cinchona calisaya TaxID=153742 RepID=A0ABD2Z8I7_9GENT